MRYNQFINEIERIQSIPPATDIYLPMRLTHNDIVRDSKKLPGNNPYRYTVDSRPDSTQIFMINVGPDKDTTIVGKLSIDPYHFPLKKAGYVDYITVHKHFTGYGIARSLYGIWLSILKRPLVSGSMQTPGGRRNWVSLNKIPGVIVKGYITVDDYNFGTQSKYNFDEIADAIMNTGANYIGKDRSNKHYFEFDVESNPRMTELQAVYKRAVNLYTNNYSYIDTGLYAVWTGK
jgi:hypothetical protein